MKCEKNRKKYVKYTLFFLLAVGVERFCYQQTAGFRESKILSTLDHEEKWDTEPLTEEKKGQLNAILDQPFYYAGHGGTSYCFASKDGNYVIKFFKHQHLKEDSWISKVTLPSFLEERRQKFLKKKEKEKTHKRRDFLFTSFLLAGERIPEETGIIHLQLNKSKDFARTLTLYDKIGVQHKIPLDQTEFVLQRKAEMIFPYLYRLIDAKQTDEAKRAIDSLFVNLQTRCSKGLADRDPHLSINFGYIDGKAVEIDIGSFSIDEGLQDRTRQKEVISVIAKSLTKKLSAKSAHELEEYVNLKLQSL